MAATADDTEEHTAGPASPSPPARRRMGPGAMLVSALGELLITAGLVLGLFVVYSLWWTNVLADRAADKQADEVRDTWAQGPGAGAGDGDGPATFDSKNGIGFLHVPAMGGDDILIEKGTTMKVLNDGVAGYYTDPVKATLPTSGKKGNFSLAAHRDGHGAKFHDIHKIKDGDPIVFETKDTWYVYKTYAILPETSKYNVDVLAKVPEESGRKKAGHYITLTTCTPVYTSKYRYVVWGELVRTEKVDEDRTPPEELR
ncbi:class E sortase [Streptomyces prasinopilosus]|uniref:LPXTG-site transpeptidase (Sortase) family protein n=1 Tax=Streptomyces prasinopilosus TaxID=67344 RepID=A0A1G6Z9R5_9ACTN|nr:class E sortase [Streptomyces prasinopilosus]SDD99388.1 LPXTG-site transpeptidase (sortase) family protein [Streptomyces prasinopilosus]